MSDKQTKNVKGHKIPLFINVVLATFIDRKEKNEYY